MSLVVFWRGSRDGWQGHVGFISGVNSDGSLQVLGGNQGNSVNITRFDRSRVLAYRWPAGVPAPR
jgi:surface antigen